MAPAADPMSHEDSTEHTLLDSHVYRRLVARGQCSPALRPALWRQKARPVEVSPYIEERLCS